MAKLGAKAKGKNARQLGVPYVNPHPDPLGDIEPTGDLEVDSAAELSAIGEAFKARAVAEQKRYKHAVDASYYTAVCFHTTDDLVKFLSAVGMQHKAFRGRYIDGYQLAAALGLTIFEEGGEADEE